MVSIHGPLGYEPNTLATAPVRNACALHPAAAAEDKGHAVLLLPAPYDQKLWKPSNQPPSTEGKCCPTAGSVLDEVSGPERGKVEQHGRPEDPRSGPWIRSMDLGL